MLQIGQRVPDFELCNQDFQPLRLSDFRGHNVAIFAFPKASAASIGCTTQACAFRDTIEALRAENAVVLGITADSSDTLQKWSAAHHLNYDLLSDPDHTTLQAWGAWGVDALGLMTLPMAQRSVWVVDHQGCLIDQQIGVNPKESVERALAALRTISYVSLR